MHSPRELANCGKLHTASVLDRLEFKPHLGGHGDKAQYSRGVLHGARALTSNGMLPHCDLEGLSTLGLKQWRAKVHHPAPVFDGSSSSHISGVMATGPNTAEACCMEPGP